MNKIKNLSKKSKIIVLSVVTFILLLVGGTFAWFEWGSEINALVNGRVCAPEIVFLGGSTINGTDIMPTVDKENGIKKEIDVSLSNLCDINDNASMNLYLELYDFPSALADPTFVWELYLDEEQISHGNFQGKQEGDTITLASNQLITSTNSQYFLYIYLDGSQDNPTSTQNQSFIFKLYGEGRDAIYTDPEREEIIVTFDPNGGTTNTRKKIVYAGEQYGDLPTPTRVGYTFLGWSQLPSEYQQVEYIESTGSQFITTTLNIEANDEFVTKSSTSSNSDYRTIIGALSGFELYFNLPNLKTWGNISIISGKTTNISSDEAIITRSRVTANSDSGLQLFTYLKNGNNYNLNGRIYYVKWYRNNTLIHNFIPCYHKLYDVIGLYDTVTDVFYTNNGTGKFVKGNDTTISSSSIVIDNCNHTFYAVWQKNTVVTFDANGGSVNISNKEVTVNSNYGNLPIPKKNGYTFLGWSLLPNEYQEVEYIESTGNQFIKTSINVEADDIFETKSSTASSGAYKTIIGVNKGFELYFNLPNLETWSGISIISGKTTNISSDEAIITRSRVTASSSSGLEIFSYNRTYNLTGKIYYVKWYRNGVLIHYFVPCYRKVGNVIGMCDVVTNEFYTNSGTGTFVAGNDVFVTSSTIVEIPNDHTLYAIWQENS